MVAPSDLIPARWQADKLPTRVNRLKAPPSRLDVTPNERKRYLIEDRGEMQVIRVLVAQCVVPMCSEIGDAVDVRIEMRVPNHRPSSRSVSRRCPPRYSMSGTPSTACFMLTRPSITAASTTASLA